MVFDFGNTRNPVKQYFVQLKQARFAVYKIPFFRATFSLSAAVHQPFHTTRLFSEPP